MKVFLKKWKVKMGKMQWKTSFNMNQNEAGWELVNRHPYTSIEHPYTSIIIYTIYFMIFLVISPLYNQEKFYVSYAFFSPPWGANGGRSSWRRTWSRAAPSRGLRVQSVALNRWGDHGALGCENLEMFHGFVGKVREKLANDITWWYLNIKHIRMFNQWWKVSYLATNTLENHGWNHHLMTHTYLLSVQSDVATSWSIVLIHMLQKTCSR